MSYRGQSNRGLGDQYDIAPTPCPYCGSIAKVFWSRLGSFVQLTKCGGCGRETRPVRCGHDASADTIDDTRNPQ